MRYLMRQKILCLGDDFTVKDSDGNDLYYIDGHVLAIGDKLSFQDMQGHELARIRQKLLAIGKTYTIERNDRTTTVHKHLFTPFHCTFSVDLPGNNDLEARGNLLDMEYEFVDSQGHTAATVSKRWFTIADTYGVETAPGWDDVLILAAAVVIDLCCHADRKE